MSRFPPLEYKRGPCVTCGARTERQAETLCQPRSDETGEYFCAGEFNEDGWSIRPTQASIKRLDEAIEADIDRLERENELQKDPRP